MFNSVLRNLKNVKAEDLIYQFKQKVNVDEIAKKTAIEAEKALGWIVDKLVEDQDAATPEVRSEIVHHLMSLDPLSLPQALKREVNLSLSDLANIRNLRSSVAKNLVENAKERLAERNASHASS